MSRDIPASVKARLLSYARERKQEFERVLTRYAAERFLYRLGASPAAERCLLKGAALLAVWLVDPYRATRDVDLLASGPADDESIRVLLDRVCTVPCPEDGLRFDLSRLSLEPIRAEEGYPGTRARLFAHLGRARIRVQVDIGFGDAVALAPEHVTVPSLLPALPTAKVRAYPAEVSIAEKLEIMVRRGIRNSRMKDFHDVWALSRAMAFDGRRIQSAIVACFDRRGVPWTPSVSEVLSPHFYDTPELRTRWQSYRTRTYPVVPPPAAFPDIGASIIDFLGPVIEAVLAARTFEASWPCGGPWEPGAQ